MSNEVDTKLLEAQAAHDDIFITYGRVGPADLPESDDEAEQSLSPTIDTTPREFYEREVLYEAARAPGDVVLSGPIIGGWGPGRYFQNRRIALAHYKEKYGARAVRMNDQTKGRWALLLKKAKNAA